MIPPGPKDAQIQWRDLPASVSDRTTASGAHPLIAIIRSAEYAKILAHTAADSARECAGLLFGRPTECPHRDSPATFVSASHPLDTSSASATHFLMLPSAWPEVWRQHLQADSDSKIVGWYHSHPGHGVFLSATDRATQSTWFRLPHHIALVIDPIRHEAAVFSGPDGLRSELLILDAPEPTDPPPHL